MHKRTSSSALFCGNVHPSFSAMADSSFASTAGVRCTASQTTPYLAMQSISFLFRPVGLRFPFLTSNPVTSKISTVAPPTVFSSSSSCFSCSSRRVGVAVVHLNAVVFREHGELPCRIFQRFQFQLLPVHTGQRHVRCAAGRLFDQRRSQLAHLHQIRTINIVEVLQLAPSNLSGKLFGFPYGISFLLSPVIPAPSP